MVLFGLPMRGSWLLLLLSVSLFLVGPRTETLPIRIYSLIEYDIDPVAAAISAVVALATLLIVIVLERVVDLSRLAGS